MIKYIKKNFFLNISMLILILLGAFFKVMAAYKTGEAFNYILSYNFKLFYKLMSISGLYFLLYLLVVYIKIQYQNYITQIMLIDIKLDIINSIEKSDYEKFNENESGTYISWLSNDMMIIEQKGFNNLYQITTMLSESLLSIFGLFFFHWSIIVFTLLLSVTTILLPSIFNNTISKKSIDYSKSLEKFISQNTNVIQGFNTLLSFNRLCNIRKSVKETSDFIKKKSMNLRKIIALSAILGALCNLLSQFGVITLTGFLALNKIVSFGAILTVESLTSNIFNSVGNILNFKIEMDTVKPLFEKFKNYEKNLNKKSKCILKEKVENIKLKDLGYSYKDKNIFSNLNYKFESGKKYAIIGESGSGKTTFLNILGFRLTDYVGDIYINDKNIKELDYSSLREQITYIEQNPYIFNGSIKDNITLYENFEDKKVLEVLNKVCLSQFNMNENATNLSGGQKQRIALARGLIRGNKIILLDEITSNQDLENTKQIEKILLDNKKLMVIFITHNFREDLESKVNGKIYF